MKKIILPLFILATCYLLLATSAYADFNVAMYPPVIQIDATPPADINSPITIQNQGNDPITLSVLFRSFTQTPSGSGTVEYLPTSLHPGADPRLFDHITLMDNGKVVNSISLAPQQKRNYNLHIILPKGESADDYYFSVIFLSSTAANSTETSSSALGGVATNVLLSIGPKGKATGEITKFSSPIFLEHGPVPFSVVLKNTSNHLLVPQGRILIRNMYDQLIGDIPLVPVNVLKGTERELPGNTSLVKTNLSTTLISNNALWNEKFLLGPYNATLSIALSDQGPVLTKHIVFYAFPLSLLLGFVLGALIIFLIWKRVKKQVKS